MDRFFDNYVMTPMTRAVSDALRPEDKRDAKVHADARAQLETADAWLDARMTGHEWAVDGSFGLAECAAAPALFYADWVHRISPSFANVHAYRKRLLARPSFARVVEEAGPYFQYFPRG